MKENQSKQGEQRPEDQKTQMGKNVTSPGNQSTSSPKENYGSGQSSHTQETKQEQGKQHR